MSELTIRKSRNGDKIINNNDGGEVNSESQYKRMKEVQKNDGSKNDANSMVTVVFISLIFDLLAFTMILPLMPLLLEHYRQNDSSGLFNLLTQQIHWFQQLVGAPERYSSVLFGGFLGSMFSFLQFVASPVVGGLSDYYGRKPLMLICTTGIALSHLLWAFSSNFTLFVLARFVGGISKGNISLCMSIITDVSSVKTRSFGMALVGVAFSVGFIAGPLIGALFAGSLNNSGESWYVAPSLCAFAMAICDLSIIAFALTETLPKEKRVKEISSAISYATQLLDIRSIFNFSAIRKVSKTDIDALRKIGLIYFLYLFLYSGLEFTVTFLMFHKFGYNSMEQAKMFLTTGIVMALLQGGVVRRLPPQATKPCAVFSLYLIVPSFVLVGLAKDGRLLYAGMLLFAISTAFAVTCLTTLVSRYGNDDQKGSVLGIFRSLGALARAIGPFVGCVSFWCFGSQLTYITGGLLLIYPAYQLQRAKL
ncbi:major facilitator superfamily domain-containing protein 10 [Anastrepha obliqua]|uniref:major facilitator superfamily domain-containing protein 10 n=1 Tax=Anastrepha obliqua TaxID=95512 RepID=UPI0024091E71|nr:major facilitator superfamily domain-containing protein 10 [Anastrepha obliqua]XP_054747114.1 major facilitator superfamily domain-containing protein 10 [Anastrepha obliqua]